MTPGRLSDREAAALALGLAAVAALVAAPLFDDGLFFGDIALLYHPLLRWSAERIAAGELPVWNPDIGLGLPQLANPILGTLYPPLWVLAVVPFTTGLDLLLAAHVGLALLLTWRALRALGVSAWPAMLGGASFALGGALLSSLAYGYPVLAWAWVPLAFEGGAVLARGEVWRRPVAQVGLGVGLAMLAGDPMAALVAGVGTVTLAAVWATSGRARAAGFAAGGVALGGALAAAQILPALALVPHSVRAVATAGAEGEWSFAPQRLLGFVESAFWGRYAPTLSYWGWSLSGTRLNDGNFFYPSHSIGVVPLLLIPAALAHHRTRRLSLALLAAAGLALLLAFGSHTPLHELLVDHLPGYGVFRYPEKWVLPATLALALVGALGLGAVARGIPRWTLGAMLGLAAVLALTSIGVIVADEPLRAAIAQASPVPNGDAARAIQVEGAALTLTVAVAFCVCLILRPLRAKATVLVTVLALCDVALANRTVVLAAPVTMYDAPARTLELLAGGATGEPLRIERSDKLNRVGLHRDMEGLVERYRAQLATLRGNAVLEAGARRVGAESPARLGHAVQPDVWLWARPAAASRILGAELLLVAPQRLPAAVRRDGDALVPRGTIPGLGMMALAPRDGVLPDVFCVPSLQVVTTADVPARLLDADVARQAIVESVPASGPPPDLAPLLAAPPGDALPCATWTRTDTAITADLTLERPALLVVRDAFAPGWTANDGGQELPILRAYGSLKGIPLGPGAHHVELTYAAPGLLPGAVTSCVAFLLVVGLWVWGRREE